MPRPFVVIVLSLALVSSACKRHTPPDNLGNKGDGDAAALDDDHATTAQTPSVEERALLLDNFRRVQFALDSASLDAGARSALNENAKILQRYGTVRVEVQGHADARGTVDYNLALGHRRALAVTDTLANMGVSRTRLDSISFGEEVPLESGQGEVVWSQNRRAEFRVTFSDNAPVQGTTDI